MVLEAKHWQGPRSRSLAAAEQDQAAGGRERRMIRTGRHRATGSVWLKRVNGYAYAYLRWSAGGQHRGRYIGRITATSRAEALAEAWAQVHADGALSSRA